METLLFKPSTALTLGVELELQIVDPNSHALAPRSKELIRKLPDQFKGQIKPEITQSMIEINSSIHSSVTDLFEELQALRGVLEQLTDKEHLILCGGGTHPFQIWSEQKIFPTKRYKKLSSNYKYLSKRSTVFGQHIHVGCATGANAIYLTHILSRYVPHFIAICASSPFYQGVDTGYNSSRSTVFNSYPLSGVMPFLDNWQDFTTYYYKMETLGIIESMKDFYWDIRPKPEFGTVEIRVCDTPLNIKRATIIASYIQAIVMYLLEERPFQISTDLYDVYSYNRFKASRYGFAGLIVNPFNSEVVSIAHDILETLGTIEQYAIKLNSIGYLIQLAQDIGSKNNDAQVLRKLLKKHQSFSMVVAEQCKIWLENEDCST